MTQCHFRSMRECSCSSRCEAIPAPIHISKNPPLINFNIRAQAVAMFIGLTFIAVPVAYASLNRLDQSLHRQQLENQEMTHHG